MEGIIFDIQRFCVHDGPGIRTTVFLKGCPLGCLWCHNPEGLRREPEVRFFEEDCMGCGRCAGVRSIEAAKNCPGGALQITGQRWEASALAEELLKDRAFFLDDGGVTFSGGECLLQGDFVLQMLRLLKDREIRTAIDTCGAVAWETIEKTLPSCDIYLYDIKCADRALHRQFTGRDNDLILANFRRLASSGATIWVRVPVIPDFNDNASQMEQIAKIIAGYPSVQKVTLMPYHTLGRSKYRTLGREAPYHTEKTVSREQLEAFRRIFESHSIIAE